MIRLRLATDSDLPALKELIPASVRTLSVGFYSPQQVESAIRYVYGPDTQLIADGTYFIVETGDGAVVGAGGWSRRRTLYGGDQMKGTSPHAASDELLDPLVDPARIRAFYVAPGWERQGIASRILDACFDAARGAGFTRLELVATLPGAEFYRAQGFSDDGRLDLTLPDGTEIAYLQMSYKLDARRCPPRLTTTRSACDS